VCISYIEKYNCTTILEKRPSNFITVKGYHLFHLQNVDAFSSGFGVGDVVNKFLAKISNPEHTKRAQKVCIHPK
jgi:hypothetical protein